MYTILNRKHKKIQSKITVKYISISTCKIIISIFEILSMFYERILNRYISLDVYEYIYIFITI